MEIRIVLLLAAAAAVVAAYGEMKEEVEIELEMAAKGYCFRLLNGTHQFGCSSGMNGNEGVVVVAKSREDVEGATNGWKERFPSYTGGFVVLMRERLLDGSTAHVLLSSSRVTGLLLIPMGAGERIEEAEALSGEAACPNQAASLYSDWRACGASAAAATDAARQWNGKGAMLDQGLRFTDWDKPVIRVDDKESVEMMEKCHDRFNLPNGEGEEGESRQKGRLCAVSMKVFMSAFGSTAECMRRQAPGVLTQMGLVGTSSMCDPLDEFNVFGIFPPREKEEKKEEEGGASYLAVVARMDGIALVPDASPAIYGTMTALVASLAAAKVYGDNRELFDSAANRTNKRLIFGYFHGEAFDYMGSSRWVYDMDRGVFPQQMRASKPSMEKAAEPIKLEQISLVLELQQLDGSANLHAHVDGKNYGADGKGKISKTISLMKNATAPFGVNLHSQNVHENGVLPPSSLHSILKRRRQTPVLLVSSFEGQYNNRRLHSPYDVFPAGDRAEEERVKTALRAVAKGVIAVAAEHVGIEEKKRERLEVDEQWLSTLFDCMIATTKFPGCQYFRDLVNVTEEYVDTERSSFVSAERRSIVQSIVERSIVSATGEHGTTSNVRTKDACTHLTANSQVYDYIWQYDPVKRDTFCYRVPLFHSLVTSPAFIADENGKMPIAGSNYSTWVESRYAISSHFHLFLVESEPVDGLVIWVGIFTLLASILIFGRCDDSSFIVDEGERAAEEGEPL